MNITDSYPSNPGQFLIQYHFIGRDLSPKSLRHSLNRGNKAFFLTCNQIFRNLWGPIGVKGLNLPMHIIIVRITEAFVGKIFTPIISYPFDNEPFSVPPDGSSLVRLCRISAGPVSLKENEIHWNCIVYTASCRLTIDDEEVRREIASANRRLKLGVRRRFEMPC